MTENHGVASPILALGTLGLTYDRQCGHSSVGRTSPCQGEGHGFESRCPLFFYKRLIAESVAVSIGRFHPGDVAKWEGKGLQNPDQGFKSPRRLKAARGSFFRELFFNAHLGNSHLVSPRCLRLIKRLVCTNNQLSRREAMIGECGNSLTYRRFLQR